MTSIDTRPPPAAGHPDTDVAGAPAGHLRSAGTYLALTYTIAIAVALALPGTRADPGPAAFVSLMVPATVVGAIRLSARFRREPANPFPLGLRRAGWRSWPAAIAIPVAVVGSSFAAADLLGVVSFDGLPDELAQAPLKLAILSILCLGEEIGWRSYLLQRLQTVMPVRRASLVTGFAQSLIHLPLILLTRAYDGDGSRWIIVPGVIVVLTAAGAMFGWLRVRSASLWPVTLAHAAVNVALIEAPVLVTPDADRAAHLTGEAGLFTVIAVVAAAVILRRADWDPRPEQA